MKASSCSHPFPRLKPTIGGFVCQACGNKWTGNAGGGSVAILLMSLQREMETQKLAADRLYQFVNERFGYAPCEECGELGQHWCLRSDGTTSGDILDGCYIGGATVCWKCMEVYVETMVDTPEEYAVNPEWVRAALEDLAAGLLRLGATGDPFYADEGRQHFIKQWAGDLAAAYGTECDNVRASYGYEPFIEKGEE